MLFFFGLFVIGPLVTSLSIQDYFFHSNPYKYLRNIELISLKDSLPGVFHNNPYKNAVNGSLWTLPVEFFMYSLVAIFGIFKTFDKKIFFPVLLGVLFCLYNLYSGSLEGAKFLWLPGKESIKLAIFFFICSCFYLYRDKIKLSLLIFLICLCCYLVGLRMQTGIWVSFLTLPYIILYFAYAPIPLINQWGKFGDFSYGIYIYAFPVQQTLVHFFKNSLNTFTFFTSSFLLTLILAMLSWHLVEKNALKLKRVDFLKLIRDCLFKGEIETKPA